MILATLTLSYATDLNLVQSKILSSGEGLTLCHTVLYFNDPEE